MRRLAVLCPLLASGCLVHFGVGEPRAWVSNQRAFEVDPADLARVGCTTSNGNVSVSGVDDGSRIVVRVQAKAGGDDEADAIAALDAIEILHKRVDGGLWLAWQWRGVRRTTWQARVSFDIAQPRSMPAKIETHNGDVNVRDVAAEVRSEELV